MNNTPDMAALKDSLDLIEVLEDLGYPRQRDGKHVCPVCGSGTHEHGTPAFQVWSPINKQWKCFSCGNSGDVFDLAGLMGAGDGKREQVEQVREWAHQFGWPIPEAWDQGGRGGVSSSRPSPSVKRSPAGEWSTTNAAAPRSPERPPAAVAPQAAGKRGLERERERLQEAQENVGYPEAVAYLEGRGFTVQQAFEFGLGFDPVSHRLLIPFPGGRGYHIDRTTANDSRKYLKPSTAEVGKQPIYNPEAMNGPRIIVVEGPVDALSLAAVGYGDETIALCGTAYKDLLEALSIRHYQGTVILALDCDDAGRKAQESFMEELTEAGIDAVSWELWGELEAKDAGEVFERDPEQLKLLVTNALEAEAESRERRVLTRLNLAPGPDVVMNLWDMAYSGKEPVKTGFHKFDVVVGGLMPGLYVLGATSSVGKTTLVLQMADQIAASGRRVLFVTLEQGAVELTAKSLSRMLAQGRIGSRISSRRLLIPSEYRSLEATPETAMYLRECRERYFTEIAPHITFQESARGIFIPDIEEAAKHYYRKEGEAPVIVIDYLQLIKPSDTRLSEKQAVDENVSRLRVLAKDLQTPILAISSLNRSSYSGLVNMSSFKESGAIEYGADVLMGLQPRRVREAVEDEGEGSAAVREALVKAKTEAVREMELVVLKNRSGNITADEGIPFTYEPVANLFKEGEWGHGWGLKFPIKR